MKLYCERHGSLDGQAVPQPAQHGFQRHRRHGTGADFGADQGGFGGRLRVCPEVRQVSAGHRFVGELDV